MATETTTKWRMNAEYLQACNCDYGCPCEFQAPPTQGHCDGIGAWRITPAAPEAMVTSASRCC